MKKLLSLLLLLTLTSSNLVINVSAEENQEVSFEELYKTNEQFRK